jgi:hypothetical protein
MDHKPLHLEKEYVRWCCVQKMLKKLHSCGDMELTLSLFTFIITIINIANIALYLQQCQTKELQKHASIAWER